jgi:hypothetical protein
VTTSSALLVDRPPTDTSTNTQITESCEVAATSSAMELGYQFWLALSRLDARWPYGLALENRLRGGSVPNWFRSSVPRVTPTSALLDWDISCTVTATWALDELEIGTHDENDEVASTEVMTPAALSIPVTLVITSVHPGVPTRLEAGVDY